MYYKLQNKLKLTRLFTSACNCDTRETKCIFTIAAACQYVKFLNEIFRYIWQLHLNDLKFDLKS